MDESPEIKARIGTQIETIQRRMPKVYAAVKAKAAEIGNQAYQLVRRGAAGEPDCFYAVEAGHVVGTPFCQAVMADVAVLIVQFGVDFLCMWPLKGGADGAH